MGATWTLGTGAGVDSLTATAAGVSVPVVLTATAAPDVPSTVAVIAGDGQSGSAGSALPGMLSVKVTDRFGNPVPNVTVQWTDDASGTFGSATSVTDATGVAQMALTLGQSPGPDDVTVTVVAPAGPISVVLHETGS